MVSLQTVTACPWKPPRQPLAAHASSPRIYAVARPSTVASHETFLSSLRQSHPTGTYRLIQADVSIISETDTIVARIKKNETKVDILVMSAGFMPFEGPQVDGTGCTASSPISATGWFCLAMPTMSRPENLQTGSLRRARPSVDSGGCAAEATWDRIAADSGRSLVGWVTRTSTPNTTGLGGGFPVVSGP
ncbi:uncharacterized protein P174DRAFT_507307 [Aspergillus novofumigatus IBT 16806]|uniref:Ketoreductase (KR) domain-containing protein n=1 Tax=Aspergillus novofumigatus (strain IBT 16806) TaxID=1392255 RepID=A0A2I1BW72_ASPN1|nr:uncharacterized protein P174DRAFT_507307 [Aspergillus novofumigatus IBT 16806]PKX89628.1 hypothetical protein P174DRAFT_507307 [Aspergillus novofumigatus IBT 16806]